MRSGSATCAVRPTLDYNYTCAIEPTATQPSYRQAPDLATWELAHQKAKLSRCSSASPSLVVSHATRPDNRMLLEGVLAGKLSGLQATNIVAGSAGYSLARSTSATVLGPDRKMVVYAPRQRAAAVPAPLSTSSSPITHSPSVHRQSLRSSAWGKTMGRSMVASKWAKPLGRKSQSSGSGSSQPAAHVEQQAHESPHSLREAIEEIIRRRHRPRKGENFIALVRQMRKWDIHLGGLIEKVKAASNTLDSSLYLPVENLPKGVININNQKERGSRQALIAREAEAMAEARSYDGIQHEARLMDLHDEQFTAARDFDDRHQQFVGSGYRAIATLRHDVSSIPPSTAFRRGVSEVLRNRYFTHEIYDPTVKRLAKRDFYQKRRKRQWRLEESIWAPRREAGNSKDFYETPRALNTLLMTDWKVARLHHQLATFVLRTQLQPHEYAAQYAKASKDEHCDAPEVRAVHEALKRHAPCIYGAFFYYAMAGKGPRGRDPVNETDISYISLNQFYEFVADCDIASDDCDLGQISNLWAVVDARDLYTKTMDPHNRPNMLNRIEWLQLIVRLAVRTQLSVSDSGTEMKGHVAEAVDAFCKHLRETLPPVAVLDANEFRSRYCYTEETDRVLRQFEPTLRTLFTSYCALGNHGMNDASRFASRDHMSIGEWLELFASTGLVQLGFVSHVTVMQAFVASRIRSCKDQSHAQEMRVRLLFFEDFLEALVRIAYVIALPNVEEIQDTNAADAGDFLMALYRDAQASFRQFVLRRTGDILSTPRQRISKCLHGLLSLMVRMVDANVGGTAGGGSRPVWTGGTHLPEPRIAAFLRYRTGGGALNVPTTTFDGSNISSVMQEIERHNTKILREVPAFRALSSDDIDTLRNAMSIAKFDVDEYVFEQGAFGDAFYLITCGYADVLRVDPSDAKEQEVLIGQLSESDCFGELALLRNEPRAASIVATSTLDVLYITRESFEAKLGKPLSDFQLAEYEGVVHSEGTQMAKPALVENAGQVKREVKR